jgi:hypothetical protein
MLYYRADCRLANAENLPTDKDETALFCRDINEKTCAACAPDYGFFILNIRNGAARLLGVINLDFALKRDVRREVTRLLTDNGLRAQSIVIGEITQNEFIRTVRNSSRAGTFDALEGVHDAYGLKACAELQEEAETICAQPLTRARALRQAKDRLCADALCAEIERLFVPTGKEGFYGHRCTTLWRRTKPRKPISCALFCTARSSAASGLSATVALTGLLSRCFRRVGIRPTRKSVREYARGRGFCALPPDRG